MFCANDCLSVRFSCLTLSSQCRSSIILFISLNDCPSYDSPVLQFRLAIQKEGEKPAPNMDIHISLHLLPVFVVVEGAGNAGPHPPLCNPSSPSPPAWLLPVSTCSPLDNGQDWPGLPQPSLPHTTYSTVQKQSAMREKHQLIPLARRQGGRESDKNSISKEWGLHGSTSEVRVGSPMQFAGKAK